MSGFHLALVSGDLQVTAGKGGAGNGGVGGAGGAVLNLVSLAEDGNLLVTAGGGGDATAGIANAGAGGAITNVKHVLSLAAAVELLEKPYAVTFNAGDGGISAGGLGGAGGAVGAIDLNLDPSNRSVDDPATPLVNEHAVVDNTVIVSIKTGDGGNGGAGGAGGALNGLKSETVLDQYLTDPVTHARYVVVSQVVMDLVAGIGGIGSLSAGGLGGSVTIGAALHGVTSYDGDFPNAQAPLYIRAGDGGAGATKGGNGGAVGLLTTGNSKFSDGSVLIGNELSGADIAAGNGGNGGSLDGGAGGVITGLAVGVDFGTILVKSGTGGDGGITPGSLTGKGGAAGGIINSLFASANCGIALNGGDGGNGVVGGGAGGVLSGLKLNTPQDTTISSALLLAGKGGIASGDGPLAGKGYLGGKGGDVTAISQTKDLNSAINLIQAGDGGASTGAFGIGGAGGNVGNVQTVGSIGIATDNASRLGAFDGGSPQGVFSGRGGAGASNGLAGAVSSITARQIAAIGASADSNGIFALASKVSGIKADLIGYDVLNNGTFDSTSGTTSPSTAKKASTRSITHGRRCSSSRYNWE